MQELVQRMLCKQQHRWLCGNPCGLNICDAETWRRLQALKDFQDRIRKYEEIYETITDRNLHYIKLIDMCASLQRLVTASCCVWSAGTFSSPHRIMALSIALS